MSEGYTDLALSPAEVEETQAPLAMEAPKYPYGLSISLDEKTLEKLDLDHGDWEVGDVFPVDVLLKVTGKNINATQEGERCCINMQIVAMKAEEHQEEIEESEKDAYSSHEEAKPDLKNHGYLRYGS